jgi:branched-chain amino acid transport system ATP-binding protein
VSVILECENLSKRFGGLAAVARLDLTVERGQIMGLIGPNGAGKSTVFAMVSGFLRPTAGVIRFGERDITSLRAHAIARLGIARVFQHSVVFGGLTVLDNVLIAMHKRHRASLASSVLRTGAARAEERGLVVKADALLEFTGLLPVRDEDAASLPHGLSRALSVAIALATEPTLLLLDEPVTGMNASECQVMTELIRQIRNQGITVLIVEHHLRFVMELCDWVTVLNFGSKLCEGTPESVRANPDVVEAYIGRGTFDAA